MIIWGGFNDGNTGLNTGGTYNPNIDTWATTNVTNAADARSNHAAVWTDSEMIVWGGVSDNIALNTGGRYNPTTDSWTATTATDAPKPRDTNTAVWNDFDSEMIVWGGFDGTNYFNTGGRYCAKFGAPTPTATPTATVPPSPTPTPSEPPCEVSGSYPSCNSTVSTEVTDFVVYVSYFIFKGVPASAFTVNGIPADSAEVGGSLIIFHFNVSL